MRTKKIFTRAALLAAVACAAISCSPVKEYQKMHLNDSEMELAIRKTQKFENSFQLYREGASGANGGKNGGGCGCN
ncbi:MAG TPA: DUF4266 domain-containing protein [Cyclobacteriaceae bacterium]|nr:DUF4266 domain-containing protein [Cyclobacteriaceae bacterium]HMV08477.1 DUF4266 domain-containing protein [Cyclobacteriaceae bacterium]HMV89188.1 DUF4266 domain-containing protein [Cyclobacteriaceae bacterium]HMX01250.1 DUF4266 domain-containing protein [Cyclobacteriaceae bacterium]HMX51336.1 DUF4266 domain-containing protein [Cyclobacteriaceae bacterium]